MVLKTFQPYVMLRGRVLRDIVLVAAAAAKSKWEGGAASWWWWGSGGQRGRSREGRSSLPLSLSHYSSSIVDTVSGREVVQLRRRKKRKSSRQKGRDAVKSH